MSITFTKSISGDFYYVKQNDVRIGFLTADTEVGWVFANVNGGNLAEHELRAIADKLAELNAN